MSSVLANQSNPPVKGAIPPGELSDLVKGYLDVELWRSTGWLTRLQLEEPRVDVRCLSERTRLIKRLMDIFVSATMLIVLSPLLLLVLVLVKLSSPGPAIFKQTRVGLNYRKKNRNDRRQEQIDLSKLDLKADRRVSGHDRRDERGYGMPFTLYKFRTMRMDAEKNGAQFAVQGDPRVTKLGRFMRKTRLDELPQLWNVLKGEMSLVGPRPERPEFIEGLNKEIPGYIDRLGLKPGLTGVAQIVNGYDNNVESFRRKVSLDLMYLQNCCIWNDIKILFKTIRVILTGSGAL
ncbi:UDP-N-acetylgalactosamine-undecaprenyl-phosphate N-acetylgalactosaminephosphotransferase [Gimesia panareensis]|uniref:UDP-N-acetylgalactosamine-undecaprenyl-phosphate N-acetylgalactosaminephosphotransferase n=1 Tax=Gimesia panareensis TaxID=2527978 RepID=A0A518FPB4_9PLAN|nr:sugar transferase [Gimesia panareensis]QDV18192.1 UDP-N-acetylgalactosamine-undecaprenyl-phosphate N-acetylgalactosaminephosphotransferase [Gimesia panareensis]